MEFMGNQNLTPNVATFVALVELLCDLRGVDYKACDTGYYSTLK